jgi:hypothetical protein
MHRLVWLVAPEVMKTTHTFKGSWFALAIVTAIVVGELVAWQLSNRLDFGFNPITVGFGAAGLVALVVSIVCDDWKTE